MLTTPKMILYGCLCVALTSCQRWMPVQYLSSQLLKKASREAPASWTSSHVSQAGIDTEWIRRFGDKTLTRLVNEGLGQNKNLQIIASRLKKAQHKAKLTSTARKPQLGVSLNGNRQQTRFLGLNIPGSSRAIYNSFGVSLNAAWELDLWGRIRAAELADHASYESDLWNLRAAEASLKAQIAKAYFALIEANSQIQVAQNSYAVRLKVQEVIAERYANAISSEGGTGSQYRIAQSDAKAAQGEVARWKGQSAMASRQLELLLGRYPHGVFQAKSALPTPLKAPPVGLPSELLLRRPDILAAERKYAESLARNEEAKRALFPSFKLTASGGSSTMALRDVLNSNFGVWSLGGSLTQSILTGGRMKSERTMRKQESKTQLITLHDTVLKAFGEVEKALVTEQFLRERYRDTAEAAKQEKEAQEATLLDFQDGILNVQDVLNTEGRALQTTSNLITLKRLFLENRIDLHLALGGDYRPKSK